jgi:hypothetical protein
LSNRENILQAILNDPSSTDSEREAAKKELRQSQRATHGEDPELEAVLVNRGIANQQIENRDRWRHLPPEIQQLVTDICDPTTFMIVPDAGTEDRLRALLNRTKSEIVTRHVLAALTNIKWLASVKAKPEMEGTNAPAVTA